MYFITTIRYIETDNEAQNDARTIGYFRTFAEAHDKVMSNAGDMFECGYYQYAVISRMGQGLYRMPQEIQWYSSHRDERGTVDSVVTDAKPEELENFQLYIIG